MANREPLGVWLNSTKVAVFSERASTIRCRYLFENLPDVDLLSPLLSCSLPLRHGRLDATNFATGLLPEGDHRRAMADLAGVVSRDTFGLLARFGRDVAGALIIGYESPDHRKGAAIPYTVQGLSDEVAGLAQRPLALYDDSELSLPGLQDKLLLIQLPDGQWARPVHGQPSTHILKVDDSRHTGLVAAEADCLRIANALGLTTIEPEILELGGTTCLLVERFDRTVENGHVVRIHQEDACQALDRDPDANGGLGKYERAGGPTFREIAGLLERWSADSLNQREQLLRVATLNVVVGNADAHGKNLALLHPSFTDVELAPLYDVVPTVLWPNLRADMAMSVNGKLNVNSIRASDLVAEGVAWHLPASVASQAVNDTIDAIREIAQTLESDTGVRESVIARSESIVRTKTTIAQNARKSVPTDVQPRQPRGVSVGGQFAPNINPEATLELTEDEQTRPQPLH